MVGGTLQFQSSGMPRVRFEPIFLHINARLSVIDSFLNRQHVTEWCSGRAVGGAVAVGQ